MVEGGKQEMETLGVTGVQEGAQVQTEAAIAAAVAEEGLEVMATEEEAVMTGATEIGAAIGSLEPAVAADGKTAVAAVPNSKKLPQVRLSVQVVAELLLFHYQGFVRAFSFFLN